MKAITQFFQHYKAWILKVLAPLGGPWAIFIIAFMDAAAFGIPMDPVIAVYVHNNPHRFLLYAFMAASGSAIGSTVPYIIGYKGGEAFLVNKIGKKRFDKIHGTTEKYGELGLIVACIMPPGFPFKLFVFSAGIAEMTYWRFLLSIFLGRMARFLLLSALTIRFGPQIVDLLQVLVKQHLVGTLVTTAVLILLAVLFSRWRRRQQRQAEVIEISPR